MLKPVLLLVILLSGFPPAGVAAEGSEKLPEEYREDEFPPFLKDLRRAEIVFFGSFPITFFLALETYEISRFLAHDRDPLYSPWPFQRYGGVPYSTGETIAVLAGAGALSLIVAIADFMIGRSRSSADAKDRRSSP